MTGSERIPYLTARDRLPADERAYFDRIADRRDAVAGPFAVLLNSPDLAARTADVGTYLRFESRLPAADREVAILATARATECAYEWAAHVPQAREAGVGAEVVDVIEREAETDALGDPPATVIEYARTLVADNRIPDATYDAARDRYGDAGVTDLTATVGYFAMMGCVLNAFEVAAAGDAPAFD